MISTVRLRQAGAKKWVTVARDGFFKSEKRRSAGMELVLDVIRALLLTMFSTSAKIFFFRGMDSVAASITRSQFLS